MIPPLLVEHGANVDQRADNGYSPLLSLHNAWKPDKPDKEHKRQMAHLLVYQYRATVPYLDAKGEPIELIAWLNNAPVNLEVLE